MNSLSNWIMTVWFKQHKGDKDVVSAFEIAERAEKSKIRGWAHSFNFELTEPIIIDLSAELVPEKVIDDGVSRVGRSNSGSYRSQYRVLEARTPLHLPDAFLKIGKRIWIVDLVALHPLPNC